MSILKGALFAGAIAIVVCSLPCVVLVVFYRKKRMSLEVDTVGFKGELGAEMWQDFDNIQQNKNEVELLAMQQRKEQKHL